MSDELRALPLTHHSSLITSLLLVPPVRLTLLHEGADAFLRVLGLHKLVEVEVFDAFERFEEGATARGVHGAPRHLKRRRGKLAQAPENLLQLRFELFALDDVANEARALRLARVEDFAREQKFARATLAHDARQKHRRDGREDAELDFGLAEFRARGRDDYVADSDQLAAAAQGRAVNDGDRGLRQLLQRADDVVEGFEHLVDRLRLMLLNRDPCAEGARAVRRVESDGHHVARAHAFGERAFDLAHHRDGEDVQRRSGERDAPDALLDAEPYVLIKVRHGVRLISNFHLGVELLPAHELRQQPVEVVDAVLAPHRVAPAGA